MNRQKYILKNIVLIISFFINTSFAGGGTWSEVNDAPSFPDKTAQVTRGEGELLQLFGQTSASDIRDSYCIKIADPNNFSVTTDANIDPLASATFDTRLFLFDQFGQPLVFNDDTAHNTSPFHSTLTGVATDGSGYSLNQPGEYTLVVSGFAHSPLDSNDNTLFNFDSGNSALVNGANPNAGRFAGWDNSTPETGDYILGLQGVEFCQENLDILGTNSSATESSLCFGGLEGEITVCNNESSNSGKDDLATGFFNKDKHLDVVFDKGGESPTLCLGAGTDGFESCEPLENGTTSTSKVALGDINNDQNLDAVFMGFSASEKPKICLGDGMNGFINSCTEIPVSSDFFSNIELAYMDTDKYLDLIVHGYNSIQICPGNGQGGFLTCNNLSVQSGRGLAVTDVNNDNHSDIVTYSEQQPSQVCINDGIGNISCSAMNGLMLDTTDVGMGDLNNDGNIDAVFSNQNNFGVGINKACLGDGLGGFICNDISGIAQNHRSVSLGDFNGDNILDAIFGADAFTRICDGIGDGTFENCRNDDKLKLSNIEAGEFGDFRKWLETDDAPSFPDGQAQVTRGEGDLPFIFGSTEQLIPDLRDAYCIKINDPENFRATTDAAVDTNAFASFDTRLFLFDKLGKPVLFNDDTPPTSVSPYASTITSLTTDADFELIQAGEYILVIGGFSDDPRDTIDSYIFNQGNTKINGADPNAGHFNNWEGDMPATGEYTVVLQGVSPCQDNLDIVGTTSDAVNSQQSMLCKGDGQGGFGSCNKNSLPSDKENVAVGYINQDSHLDTVFDSFITDLPTVCLGDGKGGYTICDTFDPGTDRTRNAVLGDINNDSMTDMVLISSLHSFQYACLGLGDGTFEPCTTFQNNNNNSSHEVQLAHMNGDRFLDVVISHYASLEICLGDGLGGFGSCNSTSVNAYSIHVADFNGDNILDIITNADGEMNHLCINNGDAVLTCSPINTDTNRTSGLAVGDLEGDGDLDVVFSNLKGENPGINKVCQNSGLGQFSCNDISGFEGNFKSIKLGLLNNDNILDVVISGNNLDFTESYTRICLGLGNGTFFQCNNDTKLPFNQIQLGEFGDFDVIFANGFE